MGNTSDTQKTAEELLQMLLEIEKPMEAFKRKTYESNFQSYCNKFENVYRGLEQQAFAAEDKEVFLNETAERFLKGVEESLSEITKKRKKEDKLLDYNMTMVVFFFPSFLEQKSEICAEFPQIVAKCWKEHFPQTNLEPAKFEKINDGFKKHFCYITTAVCTSLNKPDDCYELNLLRSYRDGYLMSQPNGEEMIAHYYDVAPTIVKHIDKRSDSEEIYRGVWENYLSPCIRMIEQDKNEECMEAYGNMVADLQNKYFS